MAETSKIEWTDATVNFWWGCTKVGPGCDHCYAEAFDKRTGGSHWGLGAPRRKIKGAVALIQRLNRNGRRRVFIQSMSDLFDLEVPVGWFADAWEHIAACDRLAIQIVTKRVSAVEKRLAAIGAKGWPRHAGLMITVVNQDEADRDVPRLLAIKAKLGISWVGLSVEPMLGPIDLSPWLHALDWVICGGESGPGARPMHIDHARSLVRQCARAGTACFIKQLGRSCIMNRSDAVQPVALGAGWTAQEPGSEFGVVRFRDSHGGDMIEWPADLRIREMPVSPTVDRETGEPVNRRG